MSFITSLKAKLEILGFSWQISPVCWEPNITHGSLSRELKIGGYIYTFFSNPLNIDLNFVVTSKNRNHVAFPMLVQLLHLLHLTFKWIKNFKSSKIEQLYIIFILRCVFNHSLGNQCTLVNSQHEMWKISNHTYTQYLLLICMKFNYKECD